MTHQTEPATESLAKLWAPSVSQASQEGLGDYQARRRVGDDIDPITDAVHAGRQRHPSPVPVDTLTRQFWERFTGDDLAYAPAQIRLDPRTSACP